jgi:autotransporter family porin
MNKAYRLVWNESLQDWVVAGEFASGKKKTKTIKSARAWQAAIIAAGLLSSGLAFADSEVTATNPTTPTYVFNADGTLIQGGGTGFAELAQGAMGTTYMSFADAKAKGYITAGAENYGAPILRKGSLTNVVTYTDPVTHNQVTMNAYQNSTMSSPVFGSSGFQAAVAVGPDGQYVDKNIYEVKSGADVGVQVGATDSNWLSNSANRVNLVMKGTDASNVTSSVFSVDDGGTLNYDSKTLVSLGNSSNTPNAGAITYGDVGFIGKFTSAIGDYNVTDLAGYQAYNTALIDAVKAGTLDAANYSSELDKATKNISMTVNTSIPADDPTMLPTSADRQAYIKSSGNAAAVNINSDANIQLLYTNATLINAEQGATVTNAGTLSTLGNGNGASYIISSTTGANILNTSTGVINVNSDNATGTALGVTTNSGSAKGIYAADSTIVNDGIINVGSQVNSVYKNYGMYLKGASDATNNGSINLATQDEVANDTTRSTTNMGAYLEGTSTLTNHGTIYVGRGAQTLLSDTPADVSIVLPGSDAVSVNGNATFINAADGVMTLGSKTQGATAILANSKTAVVDQQGTINLLPNAGSTTGEAPAQTIAIDVANGATNVTNSGTINMNGINGVGLNVQAGGQATNSGTINVAEGVDTATRTANYGIQALGAGAVANNGGNVELTGDGAIGVYAKNGGKVAVDGGSVDFVSGTKQTGFLIYGADSSITAKNSTQDVSTQDSTLYRIDGGASYASDGAVMTGSGKDSTILLATGAGSNIDTAGMTLTASGDGATVVKVEGGAHATIDATTTIDLTGTGSVAGSVQGASSTIYGDAGTTGASVLDSYANLSSTGGVADGAMGYKVATGGTLNHHGVVNITAPGSTGVQINGGTMNNDSAITVDGTAVDIIGANSVVNNTGTITATDGTAAYRLSNGASLDLSGDGTTNAAGTADGILLDTGATGLTVKDATIKMDAAGTGSGIENKAEIAGIQLTNTVISVGNGAGVRTSASLAQTNSGTIDVNGAGTGLLFQNADGSMTNKAYDMSDSQGLVINVDSAAGNGMVTNTSGDIKSGVSVNVNDAAGGAALVIGGQSASVEQSGDLQSASVNQIVDINNGYTTDFVNSGTIASHTPAGQVMTVDKQAVDFTNAAGGNLVGAVNLLSGDNSVTLEHGSQANSAFTTGAGNDQFNLNDITLAENAALFTSLDGGLGHDSLNLDNSVYTLSDAAKIQNMDEVNLANNSTFTLDNTQLDLAAAGNGWNIDGTSTLAMNDSKVLNFDSHLAGTGLVQVDLGSKDNTFAFTSNNAADGFAGTVELKNSNFLLDGTTTQNNQALSAATLVVGDGNVTDVAKGDQQIGGLAFNGGTLTFDTDTLGRSKSEAFIQTTDNLDIGGSGIVQVRTNDVLNAKTLPPDTLNVMSQDDANPFLQLAGTDGTVTGYGSNLTLEKSDGSAISDPTYSHIVQNGLQVADATYDFGFTAGPDSDGLYVNYGLQELNLLTTGADALTLDAEGATGAAADLSARLTGSGDLAIDAEAGNTVSLSNNSNDYTGKTDVRSGTLLAESDNVLGQTSELHQASGTTVDLHGYSQTVGLLNTDAGATTDFNGGSLNVTNGGTVNGALTGAGELAVNGGVLTVNGANAGMTAATTIADGAEVALNDVSGIGSGDITDNGQLTLNGAQGVMANSITGSGNLAKNGAGLVNLTTDSAQYTGTTDVNGGGLQLGDSATDVTLASATVNVADGAQFGGYGGTAGDVNNAGVMSLGDIAPRLMATRLGASEGQTFTVGQNLTNSGTINISQPGSSTVGNILHVNGDYVGNGGTLNINTQLGDDNSPTDKLVVDGNTRGTSTIAVTNVGGTGAATLNGIEVVSVGGTSDAEFSKKGRIVAGAYDYDLVRGKGANAKNWYLTNNGDTPVTPPDNGGGDTPVTPPDNGGSDTPDNGGNTPAPNVRPEGMAYASNLAAANNMFNMTLHDRLGETHYVDAFTGEQKVTSLWLRQVGGHNVSRDGSGQNKTQANRYIAQLGGDIGQWSSNGDDRYHLGVMGGYASQNSNTRNHNTGYRADGTVHGYSAGLYGTWFQDNETKTGAYVDTWALYNWFDNGVESKGLSSESYKSRGITASVESGYTWKMGEKNDHESYYIQPQAQVTWMGVKADDHKESNGTNVQFDGDGNVQTRLGVRAFIKGHNAKIDNGKDRTFEPFVEANWLHNTHDFSASMDGVSVKQVGARNIGELKTGVEAKLNNNVNLWGSVAQQMGDKGYSDTQATVGFKVNF